MKCRGGHRKTENGFTLAEVLLVVAIFAVVSALGLQVSRSAQMVKRLVWQEASVLVLERLRDEHIRAAITNKESQYALLEPYTNHGTGHVCAPFNPAGKHFEDVQFAVREVSGATDFDVNHDGSGLEHVIVYETAPGGGEMTIPLGITTGPPVTLRYDIGRLTQTRCPRSDPCNTGASEADPPGESPPFEDLGWEPDTDEGNRTVYISLRDTSLAVLKTTGARLNKIMERIEAHEKKKQGESDADCTGLWPSIRDYRGYQGATLPEPYTTPWGGDIRYCLNYRGDPIALAVDSVLAPPRSGHSRLELQNDPAIITALL